MENIPPILGLPIVALLLFLNAVFVATEFAYVTARRTRIEALAEEGNRAARVVQRALGNLDYYVAASQLGITMASIALGFIGEPVLAHLIEPPVEALVGAFAPALAHGIAIGVAFVFITALHIVLGEFVPKTIALQKPVPTAMALAFPIELFTRVFGPAIWLLNHTGNALLRLLGMRIERIGDAPLSLEELAMTLESSASAGLISRREFDLARRVARISTLVARELMIPRNEVQAIPVNAAREEVLDALADHRHTRYPVYDGTTDNIVGVLDAKSVVLSAPDANTDLRAHMQPAVVLPETTSALDALEEARKHKAPLVVLIDEYGGTAGMVSIFDIVEYLAGEFPDEFETEPSEIERHPDGTLTVDGLASLTDLEQRLEMNLPEVDAETVGGLAMTLLGRVPRVNDEVRVDGYLIRVEAMDELRVERVRLIPRSQEQAKPDAGGEADGGH